MLLLNIKKIYIYIKKMLYLKIVPSVFSYLHLLAILCICVNCGIIIER